MCVDGIESTSNELNIEEASFVLENEELIAEQYLWHKACAQKTSVGWCDMIAHASYATMLSIPVINRIVSAALHRFDPTEIYTHYFDYLSVGAFSDAYRLIQKGVNPSIKNPEGKTFIDLLLDKTCPEIKITQEEYTLLNKALDRGGNYDKNHPNLHYLLDIAIYHWKNPVTCAHLITAGINSTSQQLKGIELLATTSTPAQNLFPLNLSSLKNFVEDLTEKSHITSTFLPTGREAELKKLMIALGHGKKNNLMITGERNVGKTTLVELLAKKIVEGNVPKHLSGKRILSLNFNKFLIELNRNEELTNEIRQLFSTHKEQFILFIDDFDLLSQDSIEFVLNYLLDIKVPCILTSSVTSYGQLIETPFIRHSFFQIELNEMSVEESFSALKKAAKSIKQLNHIETDISALEFLTLNAKRYLKSSILPGTPINVLFEAANLIMNQKEYGPLRIQALKKRLEELEHHLNLAQHSNPEQAKIFLKEMTEKEAEITNLQKEAELEFSLLEAKNRLDTTIRILHILYNQIHSDRQASLRLRMSKQISELEREKQSIEARLEVIEPIYTRHIDQTLIVEVIAQLSNLPISRLMSDEKELLKNLELKLKTRVKGQDHILKTVSDSIRRSRLGLSGDNRPRAVFLFVGPSGVGKTELAKALTEELFGDENRMIRLDMSEYKSKYDHTRLIGASPGYIGYDKGGELTEALKKTPYSVVLLDEFEKADPEIADLFLHAFDDGHITDAQGNLINCKETIFIMTSNVGTETYEDPKRDHDGDIERAIRASFRTEFRNRIDSILKFKPLENTQVLQEIANYQLNNLKEKVKKLFSIDMDWAPSTVEYIAKKSFNPACGARSLRNLIEIEMMTLITNAFLDEKIQEGDSITFEPHERDLIMMKTEEIDISLRQDKDRDKHLLD